MTGLPESAKPQYCPGAACSRVFESTRELSQHLKRHPSHLSVQQDELVVIYAHGSKISGRYAIGSVACSVHAVESRHKVLPKYTKPHNPQRAALYAIIHALRNAPLSIGIKALVIHIDDEQAVAISRKIPEWQRCKFLEHGKEPANIDMVREISGLFATMQKLGCYPDVQYIASEANANARQLAFEAVQRAS